MEMKGKTAQLECPIKVIKVMEEGEKTERLQNKDWTVLQQHYLTKLLRSKQIPRGLYIL